VVVHAEGLEEDEIEEADCSGQMRLKGQVTKGNGKATRRLSRAHPQRSFFLYWELGIQGIERLKHLRLAVAHAEGSRNLRLKKQSA